VDVLSDIRFTDELSLPVVALTINGIPKSPAHKNPHAVTTLFSEPFYLLFCKRAVWDI
jgi:hypothetical protein